MNRQIRGVLEERPLPYPLRREREKRSLRCEPLNRSRRREEADLPAAQHRPPPHVGSYKRAGQGEGERYN